MMSSMPKKPDVRYSRTGDRAAKGVSSHTFRCSDEVWEAVQARAAESNDNVSDVIRRALIAYAGLPEETSGIIGRSDR